MTKQYLTLGDLIDKLQVMVDTRMSMKGDGDIANPQVVFDFVDASPYEFWVQIFYQHNIYLSYGNEKLNLRDFLSHCRSVLNRAITPNVDDNVTFTPQSDMLIYVKGGDEYLTDRLLVDVNDMGELIVLGTERHEVVFTKRLTYCGKPQLSLGDLIAKLDALIAKRADMNDDSILDKDPSIKLDFGGFYPDQFCSWAGYFEELALDYNDDSCENKVTLSQFYDECQKADTYEHLGYKGGEFAMSHDTPIWIDQWGDYTRNALVDVVDEGLYLVLVTSYVFD